MTAQKLFFYKKGKLVVESEFVSGNERRNWNTPSGAYAVTYKQRNATLNGENYSTPVSYWIPFNRNIGFHDAPWRSKFGGGIYKTSGSHGCVNMPPANAKILFENVEAGIPVLCYRLAGTDSKAVGTAEDIDINNDITKATSSTEAAKNVKSARGTEQSRKQTSPESTRAEETMEIIPVSPVKSPKSPTVERGPGVKNPPPDEITGPAGKINNKEITGPASKIKTEE